MLLRLLFTRDSSRADVDLAFRARGTEVSRLEGFSDAVFGFAITLLVVSGKAPDSFAELLAISHAVLPFLASFWVLFLIWRAQFDFFRRYGLEDRRTIRLTGMLLSIVLLAVYPVRFLAAFLLDVLPRALLAHNDSMQSIMNFNDIWKLMLVYAIGFTGVAYVFACLYAHAAAQRAVIELSELELFDTLAIRRRFLSMTAGGLALAAWTGTLAILSPRIRHDAPTWSVAYLAGLVIVLTTNAVQTRAHRRLAQRRRELVATLPVTSASAPS